MVLSEGVIGQRLVVKKVKGQGPLKRRIMEMGITKGTELYIDRTAPLGDPINIRVRDYKLSLRREDARKIEVEAKEGDRLDENCTCR